MFKIKRRELRLRYYTAYLYNIFILYEFKNEVQRKLIEAFIQTAYLSIDKFHYWNEYCGLNHI